MASAALATRPSSRSMYTSVPVSYRRTWARKTERSVLINCKEPVMSQIFQEGSNHETQPMEVADRRTVGFVFRAICRIDTLGATAPRVASGERHHRPNVECARVRDR